MSVLSEERDLKGDLLESCWRQEVADLLGAAGDSNQVSSVLLALVPGLPPR